MRLLMCLVGVWLLSASASDAALVQYRYTGLAVDGTPFVFEALIDTAAPDINADPHSGYYPTALQLLTLNGGELTCGADREVWVGFNVDTAGNPVIPFADSVFVGCGSTNLQLTGPAGIFPDDALPLSLDLSVFWQTHTVQHGGLSTYGTITQVSVEAGDSFSRVITSIPEPVSGVLVVIGLCLLRLRR